jgi:hypothetical protein
MFHHTSSNALVGGDYLLLLECIGSGISMFHLHR